MKLKNAAVAFAAAALMTATAANAATNINISIGDPGYWGVIPALTGHAPRVWNSAPVVAIGAAAAGVAAIYLNVPDRERLDWPRYCGKYNACRRPVHFVRNDWYRNNYAPAYRKAHPHGMPPGQAKKMNGPGHPMPPGQAKKMGGPGPGPQDHGPQRSEERRVGKECKIGRAHV